MTNHRIDPSSSSSNGVSGRSVCVASRLSGASPFFSAWRGANTAAAAASWVALGTAALSTGFAKDAAAGVERVAAVAACVAGATRAGDAFDGVGDCRTGCCGTGGVRSCSTCEEGGEEDGGEGVAIAFGGARFIGFAAPGPGDEAAVVGTTVAAARAGV